MMRSVRSLSMTATTLGLTLGLVLSPGLSDAADPEPLTPRALRARLEAKQVGDEADALAKDVRRWFGAANVKKGANPKVEGLDVAWAIEAPDAKQVQVVDVDSSFKLPLTRIGRTDLYAGAVALEDGAAMRWTYNVDGKEIAGAAPRTRGAGWLEVYSVHPDTVEKPGVPKGKVIEQTPWKSKVFEGTTRSWWIYVPAQYREDRPACVMVFQDGASYREFVPTVFDNLIAQGDMPVTVGVFINPGAFEGGRSNRSVEYDTLSDRYSRLILDEILPEVERSYKLRQDAAGRSIAGASSGGICAWTVAWERPDAFSKVLSWIGSFTNIASGKTVREGGHNYPALIRKTPKKPIRIFLQDGSNDLDNANGNWPLANQEMDKALTFAGYDHKFVYGRGFHSHRHGRAIMPDSLRWLWRGHAGESSGGR